MDAHKQEFQCYPLRPKAVSQCYSLALTGCVARLASCSPAGLQGSRGMREAGVIQMLIGGRDMTDLRPGVTGAIGNAPVWPSSPGTPGRRRRAARPLQASPGTIA